MFPYHGDISELTDALDQHRESMIKAYRKVLGAEMYRTLEEADTKLLDPTSFQSLAAMKRHQSADETTPAANKFFIASASDHDPQFKTDGHFSSGRIDVAPGFIFSRAGFEGSYDRYRGWISPYLAPYIHEYDHFVLFILQEKPILVAMQLMQQNYKIPRMPLCLEDVEGIAASHGKNRGEVRTAAQMLTWAYAFQEFYELSTRILDREIFLEMGLRVPASYFQIPPKRLFPYAMPGIGMLAMIAEGDPLFGHSLKHRLDVLHRWAELFRSGSPSQANFMESFEKLTVQKYSFREISGG